MSIPKKILFEVMSLQTESLVIASISLLISSLSLYKLIKSRTKNSKEFKEDILNWAVKNNLNPAKPEDKKKIIEYAKDIAPLYLISSKKVKDDMKLGL